MFGVKQSSLSKDNLKDFNIFCLTSFLILVIPGLFSKKLRRLTQEAFNCISKKIALKPCDVSLDDKARAKLLSQTAISHPKLAKFIAHYFNLLSYVLFIVVIIIFLYLLKGLFHLLGL